MSWRQFVMDLGALPAPEVEQVFLRNGAHAVTFSDAGDAPVLEPLPGETPLWPRTRITGLFSGAQDFRELSADLKRSFRLADLPAHRIEHLEDRAWEREWREHVRPMRFGRRLWVCPGDGLVPEDAVVVRLEPGLAFGTGTHPTTALALEWLDGLDLAGKRVLDFGCGSGILAIAGLRLGARNAVACDIDPQAVTATLENARRNEVDNRLTATLDAGTPAGAFDVVLANILSGTLIDSAPTIAGHLAEGGQLLLSGILEEQADAVRSAYGGRVAFDTPALRESWVRLTGRRV